MFREASARLKGLLVVVIPLFSSACAVSAPSTSLTPTISSSAPTTVAIGTTTVTSLSTCQEYLLDIFDVVGNVTGAQLNTQLAIDQARFMWEALPISLEEEAAHLRETADRTRDGADELADTSPPPQVADAVDQLIEAAHLYADAATVAANALERADPELLDDAQERLDDAALAFDRVDLSCS